MANKQFLSTQGLYSWDQTIFDGLNVPDGVDKESVIQQIIMDCSDLELLYPNAVTMKFLIEHWSKTEQSIWERYYLAQTTEFNPLYNVDAYEYETETRDLKGTSDGKASSTNTDKNKGVGYNSGEMVNRSEDESNGTSTNKNETTDSGTIKHETRRYGNIGVTKSTDLLFDYKRYIEETNIYKYISDSFATRFCLLIY